MSSTRRAIATAAMLALVTMTAACGSDGQASAKGGENPTITFGVQDPAQALLLEIALEQGYLDGAGIKDVESKVFTSVPAMLTAVGKEQIEMAVQTVPAVWNYNQTSGGSQLRIIAGNGTNTTRITVPTGSEQPQTPEQLVDSWRGKKIGVPVLAGLNFDATKALIKRHGLDPERDMELVAIGTAGAAVAALEKGLVDVLVQGSTVAALAEEQGVGTEVLDGTQLPNSGVLQIVFVTAAQNIEADAERWQAIAEGIEKAKDWYEDEANKEKVVEIYQGFDYSAEMASIAYDSDRAAATYSDDINQEMFDRSIDYMQEVGAFTGAVPAWDDVMAGFMAR
ncbi:ABC transporter substrate-binding protein [Arthrobacter sp. GCM10027362]|uniref:ABC transporter substrate-binding protein n=1 Tax=Arthrobacter sp. GCM10027362 TaxID=3273379 RepID=UPI003625EABC